jgi:hypothetical protein
MPSIEVAAARGIVLDHLALALEGDIDLGAFARLDPGQSQLLRDSRARGRCRRGCA